MVERTRRALDAASDKIGSDSSVDDTSDVVAAFCEDVEGVCIFFEGKNVFIREAN
jgi:hypothetical protein